MTNTNLLDGVEPDAWYDPEDFTRSCDRKTAKENRRLFGESRVEALLISNRKQVLLEAAEDRELLIKLITIIDRFTNERWHSAFARDWADRAASDYAKQFEKLLPELRRMALDDKGEK